MNMLPLIGFRTTEALLAASVHGLTFHGMLTLVAPLGMQVYARLGHVRAESAPHLEYSAGSETIKSILHVQNWGQVDLVKSVSANNITGVAVSAQLC